MLIVIIDEGGWGTGSNGRVGLETGDRGEKRERRKLGNAGGTLLEGRFWLSITYWWTGSRAAGREGDKFQCFLFTFGCCGRKSDRLVREWRGSTPSIVARPIDGSGCSLFLEALIDLGRPLIGWPDGVGVFEVS